MNLRQRADLMAWAHFLLILFVFFNLPLLFIIPGWNKITLVLVGGMVLSWLLLKDCWFLQLENRWRKQNNPNEAFEKEAFAQHYLRKFFNLNISKRTVRTINQIYVATTLLVAFIQLFT